MSLAHSHFNSHMSRRRRREATDTDFESYIEQQLNNSTNDEASGKWSVSSKVTES